MNVKITIDDSLEEKEVFDLYSLNNWTAASKTAELIAGLKNSSVLVTARIDGMLVGLGNAISDGHLVVYYPHLIVHPRYQNKGIGSKITKKLFERYADFHQQMLVSDSSSYDFYRKLGFSRAGKTIPMWIYGGDDH